MNTSKIIRAVVGSGRYTETAAITKEDYGRVLKIEGIELPETYEIDFSNDRKEGTSVTMIGNADGVLIPQQFIKSGKDIYAFYYHVGTNFGKTTYIFHIPNRLRPDRTNDTPEPEQQSVIDQAIAALNTAVAQTAQDVLDADASAQSAAERAQSAAGSATSAGTSASQASASATSAAQSAQQASTSASTASAAATSASASAASAYTDAERAEQAATTATNKASEATTAAQTATTKAGEASTSASTATSAKDTAVSASQTATSKATEATTAATSANTAKVDAVAAKTAAETAQGKAEDAQAAAEAVAESIPSDYSQLSADVSDLKEELNALPQSLGTLDEDADLYLSDENGNVLVAFADGHVKAKNFDSEDISERVESLEDAEEQSYIPDIMETDAPDADLDVTDSHGNVVTRFAQGHIKTKNFDSEEALERISEAEDDISDVTNEVDYIKRVRTRMCFGAHNGAEYYAPECTIPAYRIAGQQGWEWAWIAGIYFSSEGSMYVLHDGTVDRTTDGTGSVSSMTDAQIDALNITQTGTGYNLSDFDQSELKIPTFEQVVQQCVKYGMKMVIRLSDFPNGADAGANKEKWDNFLAVLNGYGVQPGDISCYLDTGTKAQTCRALISDDVEISTHLGQSATASDFVDWFETRSITGRKAAILSYQNTNLEAVKLLHSHGIRVYSYGYNSQGQADNCALWGVDIYQNGRIYKITD